MKIDPAIAELLKNAADLLSQRYEEVSMGFDQPPEPRTEWDFAAGMLADEIRRVLEGFEPAALIVPDQPAGRPMNVYEKTAGDERGNDFYDPKFLQLACHCLFGTTHSPADEVELAQKIQDRVEGYLMVLQCRNEGENTDK